LLKVLSKLLIGHCGAQAFWPAAALSGGVHSCFPKPTQASFSPVRHYGWTEQVQWLQSTVRKTAIYCRPTLLCLRASHDTISRECLFDRGAMLYLGTETVDKLWAFVQARSAFLNDLSQHKNLVHGDFQGDNILLQEKAEQWQIAAVLDWEWAHNGCILQDLGSLLRFQGEATVAFQCGIETGFSHNGRPLPFEWRMAARIWDIAANCEKLAFPRHRGEITLKSIGIIKRCLQDYAN